MKRKIVIFSSLIVSVLLISSLSVINKDTAVKLCKYPNCAENAVVFTVDDVSLSNEYQISMADKLVDYFNSNNLQATFFAIPTEMKPYNFSENIEIAQHGYSHRNTIGGSYEFLGLSDDETKQRVISGKKLMQSYGYNVSGFRAPTYYFKQDNTGILKENFEYDSSFFRDIDPYFEIPVLLHDLTFFPSIGLAQQEWIILLSAILDRPIIFSMHYYPMDKLLDTEKGREYLDDIATRVKSKDYYITTLKKLNDWQKASSKTTYNYDKNTNNLQITNPVLEQTFVLTNKPAPKSNIALSCINKENKQYCTVV